MADTEIDWSFAPQCEPTRPASDESWMLAQCFKIMMMQAGFAVVESSFVRQKNSANIMMKNTVDLAAGALLYWAFGYALAYGVDPNNPDNVNPFCGTGQFFLIDGHDAASWMFQLSFAATAATIDSGAVAERMMFVPYVMYSSLMTSLFYPIVCHWTWDSNGWLTKMGFHDFAGSGPVHLVGGASSIVAAWFIGPRIGRFADKGELVVTAVQGIGLSLPPGAETSQPYCVVRQLNHGDGERESRSSEEPRNPRWGTNLTFDVRLEDTAADAADSPASAECEGEVSLCFSTVDDWENKVAGDHSRHGAGAVTSDNDDVDGSIGGSNLSRILPASLTQMMGTSPKITPMGGHAGMQRRGSSMTGSSAFKIMYAVVRKDCLELRMTATGATKERVGYSLIEKMEDWGDRNMLMHLTDLRVLEIGFTNVKTRDTWLFKLLHMWRPTVSAQRLAIIIVDEVTDTMIGQGKMTVFAVDKADPDKFKIKTMVALDTGGKVEIDALYTSPSRMTREIFQACDPNKLLFGTFLLWINWYSFNSGSTVAITGGGIKLASSVAITTTLSACAGGMFSMAWSAYFTGSMMVEPMATGILGGLVSICAACDVVSQWESLIIGTIGAFFSINCVELVNWMKIDDPCAAIAIHFASGLWGTISVGFFARPELCMGSSDIVGLFHGGGFRALGVQCLAAFVLVAWSAGCCFISLSIMKFLSQFRAFHHLRLRPTRAEEMIGFDQAEHNIHRPNANQNPEAVLVEANAPVKLKGRSKWTKVTAKRIISLTKGGMLGGSNAASGTSTPANGPAEASGGAAAKAAAASGSHQAAHAAGWRKDDSLDDVLGALAENSAGEASLGDKSDALDKDTIFSAAANVFGGAVVQRSGVRHYDPTPDGIRDIMP